MRPAGGPLPAGVAVLAGVLALAGAVGLVLAPRAPTVPGLPGPDPFALPLARVAAEVAALATVGVLVVLTLLPAPVGAQAPGRVAWLWRLAGRWAVAWALATAMMLLLTCADIAGVGVAQVLGSGRLGDLLATRPARALLSSGALAVVVAAGTRWGSTPALTRTVLGLALAGLVPPLLTRHAGHEPTAGVAGVALAVHVPAVAVWMGGLLVLVVHLRGWGAALRATVPAFSRVAGVCVAVVGLSGVAVAVDRLSAPADLVASPYGRLVVVKVLVLVAAGVAGAVHRSRTVPLVRAGRPRGLLRLAAAELMAMALAVGAASTLAGTAPP